MTDKMILICCKAFSKMDSLIDADLMTCSCMHMYNRPNLKHSLTHTELMAMCVWLALKYCSADTTQKTLRRVLTVVLFVQNVQPTPEEIDSMYHRIRAHEGSFLREIEWDVCPLREASLD